MSLKIWKFRSGQPDREMFATMTSWPWSYDSWIYNYLYNQCLSPLMLWIRISIRARCTTLCDKVCQWLATGRWSSPNPPVSSTNKTVGHDITDILLKVALSTTKQTNKPTNGFQKLSDVHLCYYWLQINYFPFTCT